MHVGCDFDREMVDGATERRVARGSETGGELVDGVQRQRRKGVCVCGGLMSRSGQSCMMDLRIQAVALGLKGVDLGLCATPFTIAPSPDQRDTTAQVEYQHIEAKKNIVVTHDESRLHTNS